MLGALEALAEPGEVGEPARELALRVVQAFGVLERERVRAQVKNLDQSARAALRKLGVRFGAFYIYVPALLKPGRADAVLAALEPAARDRARRRAAARLRRRGAHVIRRRRRRCRPRPIASPDFASAATALCASISSSG